MRNIIMLALLALSPAAFAQDSIDVHGFHLTPDDGDLHDPLRTWRAETHERNSFGINALGEYAYRPLVRYGTTTDGETTRSIEIQDLAALNLGLFFSPHERLAITATLPAYLAVESDTISSGVGIGDMRFSAPIGVLLDQSLGEKVDLSVSVIPHLDIPGFYRNRFFRSGGVSGGGVIAATLGKEKWQASANFGAQFAPEVMVENLSGNERLLASASASYMLLDNLAVRGEWTFNPVLNNNDVPWADSPMELTGSFRGQANHQLGWVAGASTALSKGAGAATFRAFLGLDVALGARERHVCEVCQNPKVGFDVRDDQGQHINSVVVLDGVGEEMLDDLPEAMELYGSGHYKFTFIVPSEDLVVVTDTEILLLEPVLFDFDKATIRFPDSTAILAELVKTLTEHPELTKIQVATGTDVRGSNEYNMDLSARRAASVVTWLVNNGISTDRLTSIGYGETRLKISPCDTEECHESNRYAEFLILEVSE